ncbi:MAG: tRNA CCA-pyrophosphorylase [Thermoproteota archaeon]|nr:MAG: tRNA CCA-pyrophosphorylase [Candidatus Korarchaeota archaeon]
MSLSPLDVYKLLPKTNCKKCGHTCLAFATKLILREVKLEDCPLLFEDKYAENLAKLRELLEPVMDTYETGLKLDESKCTGCGNCVVVCPANVSVDPSVARGMGANSEEVVFRVEDGVAKIVNLERCRRFPPDRINCRMCEQYCYSKAIEIY